MSIQRTTRADVMAVLDRLFKKLFYELQISKDTVQRVENTEEFKQADDRGKALLVMQRQHRHPMRVSRG
jgi:hypothetical protein